MKAIKTDAIISSIRSKTDRSLSLTIHSPELTSEEKAAFMDLQGINCEMVIAPQDEPDVAEIKIDRELESKTPGQRLRGVLYRVHEQSGMADEFTDFYRREMERLIEYYKGKLE